jgi:6-phosphogluconolactonase
MKNCELISFPDPNDLARKIAGAWLREIAGRNMTSPVPYLVALSGGRIVKTFYSEIVRGIELSTGGSRDLFVKQQVHFFWGDERCVPPDDSESNFGIARDLLFEPLKIPESQIHRLHGESEEDVALRQAVAEIRKVASVANGLPVLDMIFLGMGEDGHVASLFPGEPEAVMDDPAIYRAVTAVKPPPRRITMSYGMLAAAKECWLLASGAGKEGALKESLAPDGKTPLARVLRMRSNTRIYTDIQLADSLAAGAKKV